MTRSSPSSRRSRTEPDEPDQPTDEPTTDPPASAKSAVSASASPMGGLVWDVSIKVTGLAGTRDAARSP